MRKIRLISVLLLWAMVHGVAFAQQSKSDETQEFKPYWNLGLRAGVAHTLGESSFGELVSPSAAVSAQWHFHHALGLRFGLSGWQGKGAVLVPDVNVYKFNYAQLNADFVVNLAGLVSGFDHSRVFNPFAFVGLGGTYGFDNKEAAVVKEMLPYYWEKKFFVPVRAGLGVDFRLSDFVSLGLEGGADLFSDKFNSKKAGNIDWQFNILAGLKVDLGKSTRPSKAYADKVAAQEAAAEAERMARLAAEKAEAERLAAEKAAAEKAAAEKAAEEKLAAEKLAAEKLAEARKAYDEAGIKNIFFQLGSAKIKAEQDAKVVAVSEFLKEHPEFVISIIGYADEATGSKPRNLVLSKMRSEAVLARLVELGVDASRIDIDYKGCTEQPFSRSIENRVAICILK